MLLNDKGKKKYYYKSNNFLANSYYRKNGFKVRFKNIHYKKIKNLNKFNTLIIDGEGVEEHYINNLNRMPNIKYLFFEFHNDIFTEKIKINFFKKLKLKGFKLKDSFMNSYFFTKELVK